MESVGPPMARALRNFFVAAPSRQVDCWRAGWWIIRFRAPDGLPPSRGACEASVSQDGYNAWTRGHPSRRAQGHAPQSLTGNAAHGIGRHSGMVRSTRPGISRFRVRCFASPRNDAIKLTSRNITRCTNENDRELHPGHFNSQSVIAYAWLSIFLPSAACAAARRAIGTR